MNSDFSIESAIEQIQNPNSKQYFKEVYHTYVNGNYRSSIVMLYSVLICDLVYKLRDLRDLYGDSKAGKIISEIEAVQEANPKSPEWETKLIDEIQKRTNLLEQSDIVAIQSLQQFRHLSAHPVLTSADLLFSPNKETTQSAIRNILEGVLTKPPFFSNKIFDTFLQDLEFVKDKITVNSDLKKYIESRYYSRIKEQDLIKLFASLWRVVFTSQDARATENQIINFQALKVLLQTKKDICLNTIKSNPGYYSNINTDHRLFYLTTLTARVPELFNAIERPMQILIENKINESDNYRFMCWYLKPTLKEHLKDLDANNLGGLDTDVWDFIHELSVDNSCEAELFDFNIRYFGESGSFSISTSRYRNYIEPYLKKFSLTQVEQLLTVSDSNSQINSNWNVKNKPKHIAEELFPGLIDLEVYDNLP